jgi:hypothetical protein
MVSPTPWLGRLRPTAAAGGLAWVRFDFAMASVARAINASIDMIAMAAV